MKQQTQLDEPRLRDEEIILRAKEDTAAFRPLYERYYKVIFVFVLHRIGEKNVTADITSQVFLKALLNIKRYQFQGLPFSSWLYRIAVNECNDFFRRTKRERMVVLEEKHVENLYDELFGDDLRQELKQKLPSILEKLKEPELQLIELRFLDGRPFKEIAEILGVSEISAKTRTYRILDKMKKMFVRKK
ncbi:MAG: RNA polymerase sigma factor [Bacteroidota bacterium]